MAQSVQMYRDDAGEMHDNKLAADVGDAKFALWTMLTRIGWNERDAREVIGQIATAHGREAVQKLYKAIDRKARSEIQG